MSNQPKLDLPRIGWILSAATTLLSLLIWLDNLNWQISKVTNYKLFPLFGLIAFGLMWAHYMVAALRKLYNQKSDETNHYFEITSLIVLGLILLHPGILIISLWHDGFGLPPNSYLENYVNPGLKWAALLGSISLVIFLIYELRHWFKSRSWWRLVQYASDVAMLAILVHGWKLGTHLDSSWFQLVWILYGVTYIASLGIIYMYKPKEVSHE